MTLRNINMTEITENTETTDNTEQSATVYNRGFASGGCGKNLKQMEN